MANRKIEMYQYRQIIVQMRLKQSDRTIAEAGLVGRVKAKQIREIACEQGWLEPTNELPEDAELASYFANRPEISAPTAIITPYVDIVTRWHEEGIQGTTIHQALIKKYNYTGSYDTVRRFIKKLRISNKDVTVPLTFNPGEAAQVDFGKGPTIVDAETGEAIKTWFFVMTLCWSRHQYVEIIRHQNVETWLGCHRRAFEWFGGVPKKIIIDNAKCAITKACYHNPSVQRSYGDYAEAYGFIISACPPRDPQKKGRVESGVKYVKKNFMPLRTFRSLVDGNEQLKQWITETAGNRTHGSTFEKPLTRFIETEKSLLKALPNSAPELASWEKANVHRDCHVQHAKCRYSVPYEYVGEQLWLRISETTVRIYHHHDMVALHPRLNKPGERHTIVEHLPESARHYLERDEQWCRERAQTIGASCQRVIEQLLSSTTMDYLRMVQSIIRLEESYGGKRLDAACYRAMVFDSPDYKTIKSILKKGLEYDAISMHEAFDKLADVYAGNSKYMRDLSTSNH